MTESAEVVIVGAGIMGVSTAYHLARLGAGRVVVLERDTVCSGSTALASGGIRHQYANRLGVELTTHSIVTYERFREEFGVDPNFRQHGYLILIGNEDELAVARRSVALQQSMGVKVELLDAKATGALCPYLNTDDLLGATYTPRDGYADPYLCATAIAARVRALGVVIKQQHEVHGFLPECDRVLGFSTEIDRSLEPALIERAIHRAPALADAELMRAWAGLYEMTPDQTGIVSAVPGVAGLHVIAGFSGHGFMHGPIAGQLMAEMLAHGHAVTMDGSPLDLGRFARGEAHVEPLTFV